MIQENCEKVNLLKKGQLIYFNAFAPSKYYNNIFLKLSSILAIYILSPIFKTLEISTEDAPIKNAYAVVPIFFNILYAVNQVFLTVTLIFLLQKCVQKVSPNLKIQVRNLTILSMTNCIVDFTCMLLSQVFPLSSELSGILALTWALNIIIYCRCNYLFTQSINIPSKSFNALHEKDTAKFPKNGTTSTAGK